MTAQYQFIMRTGPSPNKTYPIEGELVSIGRDSSNTIVINDAEVSRRHAQLSLQNDKLVLEDIGSTNGTYVNGQRISGPHVLKPGEVVSFGEQISLLFEALASSPTPTAVPSREGTPATAGPVTAPPPPSQPEEKTPPRVTSILPSTPAKKGSNLGWILAGVVVLLILCAVVVFLYLAPKSFWCLFPFWPAGACP
jgi:pSer/pThr/pTyr-binding forkhead associated (FHA) protein